MQRCAVVSTTLPFAHFAGCICRSVQRRGPGWVECRPHSPVHSHRLPARTSRTHLLNFFQCAGYCALIFPLMRLPRLLRSLHKHKADSENIRPRVQSLRSCNLPNIRGIGESFMRLRVAPLAEPNHVVVVALSAPEPPALQVVDVALIQRRIPPTAGVLAEPKRPLEYLVAEFAPFRFRRNLAAFGVFRLEEGTRHCTGTRSTPISEDLPRFFISRSYSSR